MRQSLCLGFVAAILLQILATPCFAFAQREASYSIACRLYVARDPAITPRLEQEVRDHIQRALQVALGPDLELQFLGEGSSLPDTALSDWTEESIAKVWADPRALLLMYFRQEGSNYVVQAREYDPQFQILSPVRESRTMQRELVAGTAARVAMQSFAPVAEVRSATGTNVLVEFRGGSRVNAYRSWFGLQGNFGLCLISQTGTGLANAEGGAKSTRYRRSFLVLRNWEGDQAECELVGPDTSLFQRLGSGSTRFFARPAPGAPTEPLHVQVVRRDGRQPHEGCEVFVSPQQYSTEPAASRGITDSAGLVRLDGVPAEVQYVSVRYEDLVLKAPLLAGASSEPLIFELPTRGRRTEYVRPLKQLLQEVDDQYLIATRLREELKAKVEAKDTAELRKILERSSRKRITLEEVEQKSRETEQRARSDGEDVSTLADYVRTTAAKKLSKQLDQTLAEFAEWADRVDKQTTIEILTRQIDEAQKSMDWAALVPLYERLVTAAPENRNYVTQLRRLQNDLKEKGPEHGRARAFVETDLKEINTRNLASRWQDVDRSVHSLLAAKDHLTLLKLRRTMNGWARELALEVKGLVDQIQAAGQDEARVEELRDTLDRLDDLNRSLLKLHKEVQDFLEKLEL